MSNRWLILCNPRSGSNHLEQCIINGIKHNESSLSKINRLGELFHYSMGSIIEDDGNTKSYQLELHDSKKRERFRKDIFKLIETDPDYAFTVRIFPELWSIDHYKILDQISYFLNHGFKLILLERNLEDCVISLVAAQSTNKWHTFSYNGYSNFERFILDKNKVISEYSKLYVQDKLLNYVKHTYPYISIRYDHMESDCRRYAVPFNESHYIKTYNKNYSDILKNYEEIKSLLKHMGDIFNGR